ncbi:TRAP-type C4-dicarboxylate transport system, large permease component [Enhygromyxa salina]|uniref:TRAP-type C4-dicarboxylate transport system, large permease component n=1 Tax=Enhygromyxa salina TaxID=215803 RepID=A0A0C1ZMT1_9BACT|nr:TRAP transporter large permease [Enhygromyxa salina]KIG18739.1 TRAP-type C4-dicarboxylate transport system, large permease component [Enhygromyxa salina]
MITLLAPPSEHIRKRASVFGALCVFIVVALLAFTAMANEGSLTTEDPKFGVGMGLTLLFAALAAMVVLGMPLFVIIGVLAILCFMLLGEDYRGLDTLDLLPEKAAEMMSKEVLLAIPFFVASGSIMSAGGIAQRLVDFARALVGWLPGGLAIAAVFACVIFAAISGSSPVTVIAIGSMMYPQLVKAGYDRRFTLGLVTSGGSLGILIPPSIPMLVYAIVASSSESIDVAELFLAGVVPGMLIGILLAGRAVFNAQNVKREPFEFKIVWDRLRSGIWALSLPAVILGGIYSGVFTPTEAAAVSVIYALIVELLIHRDIGPQDIPKILTEAVVNMGTILIIMALAFGLNAFLVEEMIPERVVEWILARHLTPITFLLIINIFLLFVGALMDSISAILIIAPLLAPIGTQLGIDPIHLGIIFIVNLEIGYLTPPIGINLFVASSVFRQPLGEVARGVIPFIGLMLIGLMAVTYVPSISLGLVNKVMREKPFYEPFPDPPAPPGSEDDPDSDADVEGDLGANQPTVGPTGERVMSVAEMMAASETEGEDEDEDEDEDETEGGAKPAFDSSGMNMVPVDPDEDDDDYDDDDDDDIKPAFDSSGMNMVPG